MALDPRIPLQAQTPDLLSAVQKGLGIAQSIRQQPLREALMRQQAEQMAVSQSRLGANRFIGTPQRVERDGQNFLVGLTQSPTGQILLSETPVNGQFISGIGETAQDQLTREIKEAEAKSKIAAAGAAQKVTQVGASERIEGAINDALDATESISDIGRSFELLQAVGTGKPQQTLLAAKQFFGIETADEGELKSLLGRAVISNLRSSFGGNPTEGERAALAEIETSFSQQGEVNIRLLNRALSKLERRIDRGISAAKKAEDGFSLERLTSVMTQIDAIKQLQKNQEQSARNNSESDSVLSDARQPQPFEGFKILSIE